jgi:hypothetical protein
MMNASLDAESALLPIGADQRQSQNQFEPKGGPSLADNKTIQHIGGGQYMNKENSNNFINTHSSNGGRVDTEDTMAFIGKVMNKNE